MPSGGDSAERSDHNHDVTASANMDDDLGVRWVGGASSSSIADNLSM